MPTWHCWIIDDSSPVTAAEELEALPVVERSRFSVIRQPNCRPEASRNRGLDALPERVGYVAFLDSDDTWSQDHLALAVTALDRNHDFYFADYHRSV